MKKLFIILIIGFLTCSIFCQVTSGDRDTLIKDIRKNSIYFEAVGNGSFYSINYERLITKSDDKGIGFRIGYTYFNMSFAILEKYYLVPMEINLITGKKHCFEIGCGLTLSKRVTESKTERCETFVFRIGYRYRGDKGIIIRLAPLIKIGELGNYFRNNTVWLSGGLSIGYSF